MGMHLLYIKVFFSQKMEISPNCLLVEVYLQYKQTNKCFHLELGKLWILNESIKTDDHTGISPWLKPPHVCHHSALYVHCASTAQHPARPLDFPCSPQSCSNSDFYSDRLWAVHLDLLHESLFCTPLLSLATKYKVFTSVMF